jgi:hypothetical protein
MIANEGIFRVKLGISCHGFFIYGLTAKRLISCCFKGIKTIAGFLHFVITPAIFPKEFRFLLHQVFAA